MGEHTPGPFVIEDLSLGDKAIVDITANHAGVGEAYSKDAISGKALPAHANATLWAAAPDLLAVCQQFVEMEGSAAEGEWHVMRIINALLPIYDAAEAAIAKAQGGNET